ncbi:MAG: hypothetical protein ACLFQ8_03165 [Candidatus Aenigmatarchaeota archaeon]
MVGRKGFVYIMEVVLISVILVVSLGFLLRPLDVDEDWTSMDLGKVGRSALLSIDRRDGLENTVFLEEPYLEDELDELFYSKSDMNVRYNLRMEHTYARKLTVGFNCTGEGCSMDAEESHSEKEEYRRLWETIDESWMNNRSRNVVMEGVKLDGDEVTEGEIDVLFIRGEDQLEEANESIDEIKAFLDSGGAVIQLTDFNEVNDYAIQEEIFELENPETPKNEIYFENRYDPEKPNYEPSKLFYGVGSIVNTGQPGITKPREGTWKLRDREYTVEVDENDAEVNVTNETGHVLCSSCSEGESFELDIEDLEGDASVRKIRNPDEGAYRNQTVVWFDYPGSYEFLSGSFTSSAEGSEDYSEVTRDEAVMVLNEVHGGRTVWVSSPEDGEIGADMKDDLKSLIRAGLLWSGERGEWLKEAEKSPERRSSYITHYGSYKKDIYEPYKITMEIWYTY